jgi:hypothetical protein
LIGELQNTDRKEVVFLYCTSFYLPCGKADHASSPALPRVRGNLLQLHPWTPWIWDIVDFRTIDVIGNPAIRFLVTVKYQIGVSRSKQNRHLRMTTPMACQHPIHIVLPAIIIGLQSYQRCYTITGGWTGYDIAGCCPIRLNSQTICRIWQC